MKTQSTLQHDTAEYIPSVGTWYKDVAHPQRHLFVREFDPSSAIERHVVGQITWTASPPSFEEQHRAIEVGGRSHVGDSSGEYACSLRLFQAIWRPM